MMTQLRQSGKLQEAAAVLFGEMPHCVQSETQGYELDDVLRDLTVDLGVPVLAGLPCGHTTGVHRALPFGVHASVETEPLRLTLDEPIVA